MSDKLLDYSIGFAFQQTVDGGFILLGNTTETDGFLDFRLTKVDAAGNQQWVKYFGRTLDDSGFDLKITPDGGYILVGRSGFWGSNPQAWIIKTDASGNKVWDNAWGGSGHDEANGVALTNDGGYLVVGVSCHHTTCASNFPYSGERQDAFLLKLNSSGQEEWHKFFNGLANNHDHATKVYQRANDNIVIVGATTDSGGYQDLWLLETDQEGNLLDSQIFGGDSYYDSGRDLAYLDSGYALIGLTSYGAGGEDVYFVTTGASSPVAQCANRTVSAGSNCQADASVDEGSFDPDGDDITLEQSPAGPYSLGSHPVTLTVSDDGGNSASCQATVTVVDDTAPTVTCPANQQVECSGPTSATVLFAATGGDNCASVTPDCSPPAGVFPLGQTPVTCTATDGAGNQGSCGFTVQVVDTTPPTIQSVSATPSMLWPPNHQMVPVGVTVNTVDVCDPQPACKIKSVTSNEPENGLGDGDTAPDWQITGDLSVNLRAERSGKGNGRIYTINVQCADDAGNTATDATTVTVPHSQGKK